MDSKREEPKVVVLFGPPGSGKSTQAKLLKGLLGLEIISPGDMLRAHMRSGDSLGQQISLSMQSGMLVPDEIVNVLVSRRIEESDCSNGFILDGYPRTTDQASSLAERLATHSMEPIVVRLVIDIDIVIRRLLGRRQCPSCGTLYQTRLNPPKSPGVCDHNGSVLLARDDDRKGTVQLRLQAYEDQTTPVMKLLKSTGYFCRDVEAGVASPNAIMRQIEGYVRQPRKQR